MATIQKTGREKRRGRSITGLFFSPFTIYSKKDGKKLRSEEIFLIFFSKVCWGDVQPSTGTVARWGDCSQSAISCMGVQRATPFDMIASVEEVYHATRSSCVRLQDDQMPAGISCYTRILIFYFYHIVFELKKNRRKT